MRLFSLFAAIVAVAPLSAGVRIQMEETDISSGKVTMQQLLLDSDRFRVDTGADTSVLFLTDGGRRMVMLDRAKNQYRVIDEAMMKQMGQRMSGAMAELQKKLDALPPEQRAMMEKMMKGGVGNMGRPAPRTPTVYTSAGSGSVNGISCTKYNGVREQQKVAEVCAANPSALHLTASNIRVFDEMRGFVEEMMNALANSPFAGGDVAGFAQIAERGYEGFPVQRTTFANGKATKKDEVKQAEETNLSDADFSLGDAKQVQMPGVQ